MRNVEAITAAVLCGAAVQWVGAVIAAQTVRRGGSETGMLRFDF